MRFAQGIGQLASGTPSFTSGLRHLTLSAPSLSDFSISFCVPTFVLFLALAVKLPTILRLWRDPLLRAVGGMLLLACAVFVFVAPATIVWTNRVTGIANFSAPWCYSLLTAFAGACLLLLIAWRAGFGAPTPAARRAKRWVIGSYSTVIVALWVLFALADVPEEHVRDLDTFYANTPYIREVILLYLLAHTVAVVITLLLIRNWLRTEELDGWLRAGLVLLLVGYGLNLAFDVLKLTAVTARWTGHDLDWLSTHAAPLAASLSAILAAVGFILPHSGQYLSERWELRTARRELGPLYTLVRSTTGRGVPFSLRASAELRLVQRETFIRDELLRLSRHFDTGQSHRSYTAARALGHEEEQSLVLAATLAVQDAAGPGLGCPHKEGTGCTETPRLLQSIAAISRALRDPETLKAVRARAATLPDQTAPAPRTESAGRQ